MCACGAKFKGAHRLDIEAAHARHKHQETPVENDTDTTEAEPA